MHNQVQVLREIANTLSECLDRGGIRSFGTIMVEAPLIYSTSRRNSLDDFVANVEPLPSIALTTDTSILTAIGNDYGYGCIFAHQVEALGRRGDVLVGISTSLESKNMVKGMSTAKAIAMKTVAFTGMRGGLMAGIADLAFIAFNRYRANPRSSYSRGHMFCDQLELNQSPTGE